MRYLTCEHCRFDASECARRQSVAAAVQAFNAEAGAESALTSIRFRCPDRFIGYEVGRKVVVTEALVEIDRYEDERTVLSSIAGLVVDQKGDKVRVWLETETSQKKRLIYLYPMPWRNGDWIGVRSTHERLDAAEAVRLMVREIREARGEAGGDEWWCPKCRSWRGSMEVRWSAIGPGVDNFLCECGVRVVPAEEVADGAA